MSERPSHEPSCEWQEGKSWYWCTCRMGTDSVDVGCQAEGLEKCRVCFAVVRSYDTAEHLDWHWKRGDFA